ncbi:Superoxide-generating NADPH oxidase heavy chain subunit A (NADPH oxidase A) (Superoxide-generating NADPH oxidase flavocytochrome A) [Durusdinium trenchii]|uniref:Superoxide-generating NADPH oxidase heavy chain subunit A (NADPH oxidase A) (Superoxide-generating NADPH oxidase flavocytochrome A) n=1 Tax=Durusdinium trenchii TaxID=1381693 RepID=A0ABP0RU31_9DINO
MVSERMQASEATLDKVLAALDEHGFCILERFLSPERTDAMKEELTAVLDRDGTPTGRNPFEGFHTRRMYAVFAKTRSFDDLVTHPLILSVMEAVLGSKNIILSSPTGIEIGPGEVEQLVHRDDGKYPFPKVPMENEVIMNSMWAFDDFTEDNGSTVIFPGSHKLTSEEQLEIFRGLRDGNLQYPKISACMPKGSVMLYRGSLLHGGGANTTDKTRLGVILELCVGWLRQQEQHILAVPPQVVADLPERLQELLGYSVELPFVGYVNGYHPKKTLPPPTAARKKPAADRSRVDPENAACRTRQALRLQRGRPPSKVCPSDLDQTALRAAHTLRRANEGDDSTRTSRAAGAAGGSETREEGDRGVDARGSEGERAARMGGEEWFQGTDKKTGATYYYNTRGDVSYTPPPGWNGGASSGASNGASNGVVSRAGGTPPNAKAAADKSWFGALKNVGGRRPSASQKLPDTRGVQQQSLTRRPNPAVQAAKAQRGTPLRVLYNHIARFEDELTLRKGDVVIGLNKVEGGTWWYGELNGKRGHFPANFVEVVEPQQLQARTQRGGRPKPRPADDGASSSSWFAASAPAAPSIPQKPQSIALKQTPRKASLVALDQKRVEQSGVPLRWTYLAHNWGFAFGLTAAVTGVFAILWHSEALDENVNSEKRRLLGSEFGFVGPVVAVLGAFTFWFESVYGLEKTDDGYKAAMNLPYRSIMYAASSVPCFFAYPTILAGCVGVGAAGTNYMAERANERGTSEKKTYLPKISKEVWYDWSFMQAAIVLAYVGVNAALFLGRYIAVEASRQECLRTQLELSCLSFFAPFAKGFGTSLDLTCALILVPVMRATVNKIANIRTGPNQTLANVVPVKKNIAFHRLIGYTIALGSVGHVAFHLANFAIAPVPSIEAFGGAALWTGGAITLGMTIIFTAAHNSVRRSYFEAFFTSHHFFLIVFPLLLAHGPKFWYGAVIALPLYMADRVYRARRGTTTMYVDYVRFQNPVLKLHFFPDRIENFIFQAGQYLFIQCPHISENEWHPFTISSSFGDLEKDGYISLHIRVQKPGSWTHQFKNYMSILAGSKGKNEKDPFESYFTHYDSSGAVQRGKRFGPDGKVLIRIEGPHSAPAMTYSGYDDVMLCGSGIGLTPSAAILSAVTRHKWKKGFMPRSLRFYWIVRHSEVDSFDWFIELLADISKRVYSDRLAGAIGQQHRLAINIYVTRVPSNIQVERNLTGDKFKKRPKGKQRKSLDSRVPMDAGFLNENIGIDFASLKQMVKAPVISSQDQYTLQFLENPYAKNLPNRLGDIFVWSGRPDWDQIFQGNRDTRLDGVGTIGVTYCGAPAIGSALKGKCKAFSGSDCEALLARSLERPGGRGGLYSCPGLHGVTQGLTGPAIRAHHRPCPVAGVKRVFVINSRGQTIRSSLNDPEEEKRYAGLISELTKKTQSMVRELDPEVRDIEAWQSKRRCT